MSNDNSAIIQKDSAAYRSNLFEVRPDGDGWLVTRLSDGRTMTINAWPEKPHFDRAMTSCNLGRSDDVELADKFLAALFVGFPRPIG